MTREFPLAPLERIFKDVGASRVSQKATEHLRDSMLEKGEEIARKAIAASKHAKRVTIKSSDIKMACK